MTNAYDLGDLVRCTGAFVDASGAPIDPAVVKFDFKTPAAVKTTYVYGVASQLNKDGVGNYHVDIDANLSGRWFYRFYSTGSGQAAHETYFDVVVSML